MPILVLVLAALSLSASPASAAADLDRPITKASIAARVADLSPPDKSVPDDLIGLNDERQSLIAEMSKLRAFVQEGGDYSKEMAAIEKAKGAASQALSEFSKLSDCKALSDAQIEVVLRLRRPLGQITKIIVFNDLETIESPWDEAPSTRITEQSKPQDLCARWKAFLGLKGKQEGLLGYFDTLKTTLSDATKSNAEAKSKAQTLIEVLQKRREVVEGRLAKKAAQDTLTDKFWIALLVIGIFSVGTILAVKLFTPDIQLEWVASGQVIQFVTVMILLSVVMALGLAGILKENTLGTLLGGIAGYVLAQGVGRAAAREVSRGQVSSASGKG